jgi:hypothetical protein
MSNKIRAYISHSIRGKFRNKATKEQERTNCERAIKFGNLMREEFSNIDFYIPGEHIELDLVLRDNGYITTKQLLDVDCKIIDMCNFIVVYSPDDYIGIGMKIEIDHATLHSIPIISSIDGTYDEYIQKIIYAVNCHLISMLR